MNYIQKLEGKARSNDAARFELRKQLDNFRMHLASPKFSGVDSDGSRKDWISVGDVLARLEAIEASVTMAAEEAEQSSPVQSRV